VINKSAPRTWRRVFLISILLGIGFLVIFVTIRSITNILGALLQGDDKSLALAVPTPETLDDQRLVIQALQLAHENGLEGEPAAQRVVRMTLGEWGALSHSGVGPYSPDLPIFIMALRGDVVWKGLHGPETKMGRSVDNMTIVLDARNATLIEIGYKNLSSQMTIQVPLNATTPLVPIAIPPTRTPFAPPTVPPFGTLPASPTPTLRPASIPTSSPTVSRPLYP
jgi:hypothetical protein